jgi:hypothetical protein
MRDLSQIYVVQNPLCLYLSESLNQTVITCMAAIKISAIREDKAKLDLGDNRLYKLQKALT